MKWNLVLIKPTLVVKSAVMCKSGAPKIVESWSKTRLALSLRIWITTTGGAQ